MIIVMPNSVSRQAKIQGETCFQEGIKAERKGDVESAIEFYNRAINLDPLASLAMVNLGVIYFYKGNLIEAERLYREAIEVSPQYSLAYFNLAVMLDELGNNQSALGHYLLALKFSPEYGDAHYNIALLYQRLCEEDKAIKHFRKYIKLEPSSSWTTHAKRKLAILESKRKRPTLELVHRNVLDEVG